MFYSSLIIKINTTAITLIATYCDLGDEVMKFVLEIILHNIEGHLKVKNFFYNTQTKDCLQHISEQV